MEHFSYKSGCGMCGCMNIETQQELAWTTDKWLRVISNVMLFKITIPLRN